MFIDRKKVNRKDCIGKVFKEWKHYILFTHDLISILEFFSTRFMSIFKKLFLEKVKYPAIESENLLLSTFLYFYSYEVNKCIVQKKKREKFAFVNVCRKKERITFNDGG